MKDTDGTEAFARVIRFYPWWNKTNSRVGTYDRNQPTYVGSCFS